MTKQVTESLPIKPTEVKMEPLSREQIHAAIELLDSWCNVSEAEVQEQRQTGEYLKKVLDEDRLSNRQLFP